MLAGVCTGIAKNLDVDPVLVRVGFILGAFANGVGILAYILLWVLVPQRPYAHDLYPEADIDMASPEPTSRSQFSPAVIFGGLLIAVGVFSLLDNIIPGFDMSELWPLILIALGIGLVVKSMKPTKVQEFPTGQEEPRSSL